MSLRERRIEAKLDLANAMLRLLVGRNGNQGEIMAAIDDLRTEVTENTSAVGSAVTLLGGLTARINELIANGNNDPALAALAAELDANTNALAEAVAANTLPE